MKNENEVDLGNLSPALRLLREAGGWDGDDIAVEEWEIPILEEELQRRNSPPRPPRKTIATDLQLPQSGSVRTRGEYGFAVTVLTAVVYDRSEDGWRPATQQEVDQRRADWGAWDGDWGFMAPWPPEETA
jgi:hypothetical protein